MRVVGDDHPKACTGRRLLHRGLARAAGEPRPGAGPVVLDPYAAEPLSPADRGRVVRTGLLVIDCSWNRLSGRGRFPDGAARAAGVHRRLPILVAANPQHFGRVAELNTVEALAAALSVLGRDGEAGRLLEGFAGGANFLAINRERLVRYAATRDGEQIRAAERALFAAGPD
ncbi:MAG TPA: DUF367 domain-containing protein [Thermoplasmata archaeon]|nr:DUF367 domain-containing protein [Thermoplasmata archaeon]